MRKISNTVQMGKQSESPNNQTTTLHFAQVLEGTSSEKDMMLMGFIGCLHRALERLKNMPGGNEFKLELGQSPAPPAVEERTGDAEGPASVPATGMGLIEHIVEEVLLLAGRGDGTGV